MAYKEEIDFDSLRLNLEDYGREGVESDDNGGPKPQSNRFIKGPIPYEWVGAERLSDALTNEARTGHMADVTWLTKQHSSICADIADAEKALVALSEEKQGVLDAGLPEWRQLPIDPAQMPCTYQDAAAWFHGHKGSPTREEI